MSLTNGWTGGQYSLFRAIFGCYLGVHWAALAPWAAELFSNQGVLPDSSASPLIHLFPNVLALYDGPAFVTALLVTAAGLSVLFALGWHDRPAALGIWYIAACLFGRNPLIANPGLPYVGWLLLAHVFLPPAPYGSLAARGRPDPGCGWRMPGSIFAVAWILLALGYSYSGYTKLVSPSWVDGTALERVLNNPLARPGPVRDLVLSFPAWLLKLGTWAGLGLELSFAPLALFRRARPIVWGLLLLMHLSLIVLIDFADLSFGMVMIHFFTFDPAWIRPLASSKPETIFYDGGCGLCHRWVRFVLAEDRTGQAFRFAPLQGDAFQNSLNEKDRANLPDSVVVLRDDGRLLMRSRAIFYILRRLGGLWRLLAAPVAILPAGLMDGAYDAVARIRHRLFPKPGDLCPVIPADLRKRFDF
jgi:predicted DCC family thiol-disulfide oxidoreductase YuxK